MAKLPLCDFSLLRRSQAVEAALADKLRRLARTRLATESAKLNPREEKRLADLGLAADLVEWPEY